VRHALAILAVLLGGCDGGRTPAGGGGGGTAPASKVVEPDTRPSFVLVASQPFVIEFGRGSGMNGLDVVRVDETGAVRLDRIAAGQNIVSASLTLPAADTAKLVGVVNDERITSMGSAYHDPRVHDGSQWVLWVRQGTSEKSIYFNNSFPDEITAFAATMDAMLESAGVGAATWTPVAKQEGADRQAALWARIEPAR
jgi:hypothetical protein